VVLGHRSDPDLARMGGCVVSARGKPRISRAMRAHRLPPNIPLGGGVGAAGQLCAGLPSSI